VNSAKRTGITNGWRPAPAEPCGAEKSCLSVSVNRPVPASGTAAALRRGVPDCAYQRLNAGSWRLSSLSGLASAMACAKSVSVFGTT